MATSEAEIARIVKYKLSPAWTSYGATSTITGWSALTTQEIYYLRLGGVVFVIFYLRGTSDATTVSFTLPLAAAAAPIVRAACKGMDNGTAMTTPSMLAMAGGSGTVDCYKDFATAAWTNSGEKYVVGEFFYIT